MTHTVIFSIFGTTKDGLAGPDRWERWRPTVSLCQHEGFMADRLELIFERKFKRGARALAKDIESISPETEVVLREVDWRDPWDFADVYGALSQLAEDYSFNEEEERYLVHTTTGTHVAQICLFLLAESRRIPAQLIQSMPPKGKGVRGVRSRGRTTGVGSYSVIDLDLSRYDQLATRFAAEREETASFLKAGIETRSDAFNDLIDRIEAVACRSKAPMLLTGATGVGKTALARRIFELKETRRMVAGEFVEVNCATLRGDGAMSALFGHERGAFTGAQAKRAGLLSQADGGLLFLDEVGELGLDEQAMLLRAIEEGVFMPLGSDTSSHSDFQLIAGTNRDLYEAVRKGTFREDLLARIDLWSFELPALRERLEDLEPNVEFELDNHARAGGRSVTFNREARERFLEFARSPEAPWTANFRDFGSAVTRMVTFAGKGRITLAIVEEEITRLKAHWRKLDPQGSSLEVGGALVLEVLGPDAANELDLFDRVQLEEVLRTCRRCPSLSAAGRELFARSRLRKASRNDADRLKKYLARFELEWSACRA